MCRKVGCEENVMSIPTYKVYWEYTESYNNPDVLRVERPE